MLKVTRKWAPRKVRRVSRVGGCSTNQHYSVHNSTISNLERGVLERVFFVKKGDQLVRPPQPQPGVVNHRLRRFKLELSKVLPSTTPVKREDFPLLYEGRKRTRYQKAVEDLKRLAIRERDSYITVFGKVEKTNFDAKPDAVQRIISPRSYRYNVEVGRFLKPLEHQVVSSVDRVFGSKTIFKGLNASDAGEMAYQKWNTIEDPVAIGLDASRFDQHVSVPMLKWEHEIYLRCFNSGDRDELAKLLKWQLTTTAAGYCRDGKLKFRARGGRCSGDMNTGLGNCLLMCALVWTYCRGKGLTRFELMNNGDDCVVIINKNHLTHFIDGLDKWFHEMGFNMKVEKPVYIFEQIEFCQAHPVYDGVSWRMVRTPQVSMEKDSISIKPFFNQNGMATWCNAVGEAGLSLTGGLPVLQEYYNSFTRVPRSKRSRRGRSKVKLDPTMETGMMMLAKGMNEKYRPISTMARVSYCLAFGVTPEEQIVMEGRLKRLVPRFKTVQTIALDTLV